MTTGYLWSGQFEELKKVITEGQPHSMELDEKTLDGHWATDNNLGVEFFIINDAVFSKLCILGDDIEPCFEGSAVTSPEVSKNFAMDKEFSQTLFTMMNELKDALSSKGGLDMPEEFAEQTETTEEQSTEFVEETVEETVAEESVDYTSAEEAPVDAEAENGEFEKSEEDKDDSEDSSADFSENKEAEEEPASEYSAEEFAALQEEIEALRAECQELRDFKLNVENEQKDALINSYYMLSEEDKREIMEHKSEFTLDEIKAKLAVIYVEKNVDFSTLDGQPEVEMQEKVEEEDPITTFSLDEEPAGFVSPLQEALRRTLFE